MLIRRFPFADPAKIDADRRLPFGVADIAVLASAESVAFQEHTAPTSLKFVLSGAETYVFDGARRRVSRDAYIVLNHDQPYASVIEPERPAESLCFFFAETTLAAVRRLQSEPEDRLLDAPDDTQRQTPSLRQTLRPMAGAMEALCLDYYRAAKRLPVRDFPPDLALAFCTRLFREDGCDRGVSGALDASRRATRGETRRRLLIARDYLFSHLDRDPTLDELAKVAMMSKFHLLRRFRELFGAAPGAYGRKIRLQRARRLVRRTRMPVSEIAVACGYADLSAFSRAYRAQFGHPPSADRGRA